MNFLRTLLLDYTPPAVADKGDLAILREKILQGILLVFFALGTVSVILAVSSAIRAGDWPVVAIYLTIFAILIVTLFWRNLKYSIRGNVAAYLIYMLALSELFESGSLGEVRMFLITFVALNGILFHFRNTVFSLLLSLLTIAAVGTYVNAVEVPFLPALANLAQGTDWVTSSVMFVLLAVTISGSAIVIISGLESNLLKQEELTQSLEYERDALEDRIQERTRSISRRLIQLRTAAEVSRSISALTEPEALLQEVVELIRERFELYYVGSFLIEPTNQYAVLTAGSGEAGRLMMAEGHRLAVGGSSMIGWTISNRQPRIALDVGAEAVRFSNPNLPLTRSELALPINARDRVLGAMTVQSTRPNAFDENDITVLQGIADSLGTALDNDRLFKETRQSLEEIRALNREYLQRAWAETIDTYGELQYTFDNPVVQDSGSPTQMIELPLVLRDEVIGYLSLETDKTVFSSEEGAFIDNITNQTAIALENARLIQETERRAVQEQKINELTTGFTRAISIDEILRAAVQELGQLPSIAQVSVRLSPGGVSASTAPPANHGNGKEPAA